MRENMIKKATDFLWDMMRLNLYFGTSNIVFIVVILTIPMNLLTLPVYLLSLCLLVPSLLALFLTLKRYEAGEKSSVFKLFVRSYREEFKGSGIFFIGYSVGALVLLGAALGLQYVPIQLPFAPIYLMLAILLYVHFIFALLIRVSFIISIRGTWRLGLYCFSKYPLYALFILGGTFMIALLINLFSLSLALGIVPMAVYVFIKYTKKLVKEIAIVLKL